MNSKDHIRVQVSRQLRELLSHKSSFREVVENIINIKFEHVVPIEDIPNEYVVGAVLTNGEKAFVCRPGYALHLSEADVFPMHEAHAWARIRSHDHKIVTHVFTKAEAEAWLKQPSQPAPTTAEFKSAQEDLIDRFEKFNTDLEMKTKSIVRWNPDRQKCEGLHAFIGGLPAWTDSPDDVLTFHLDARAAEIMNKLHLMGHLCLAIPTLLAKSAMQNNARPVMKVHTEVLAAG